jgi:hypothetical protein
MEHWPEIDPSFDPVRKSDRERVRADNLEPSHPVDWMAH